MSYKNEVRNNLLKDIAINEQWGNEWLENQNEKYPDFSIWIDFDAQNDNEAKQIAEQKFQADWNYSVLCFIENSKTIKSSIHTKSKLTHNRVSLTVRR